jgi:LPS-assembly protein
MYIKRTMFGLSALALLWLTNIALAAEPETENLCLASPQQITPKTNISSELGWIQTNENRCGGYYNEPPFTYSSDLLQGDRLLISSSQMLFSLHGTSSSTGKVTITRYGQQIIASKAYIYRNQTTGKMSAIDLISDVTLREPNSIIIAKCGHFDIKTKAQSLHDILYRTAIYSRTSTRPGILTNEELQVERQVYQLSAWGEAGYFKQSEPKVYEFQNATYTTCPPTQNAWRIKASSIELDKNTGRGVAKNASLSVHGVPIFYTPYLNFPIDSRRQTGFLNPTAGTSSKLGGYISLPFYWNLAPNYDTTITPSFMNLRGVQVTDTSRYLTESSLGTLKLSVLPKDKEFQIFKATQENDYQDSTSTTTEAELRRLQHASDTRKAFAWENTTRFGDHWSADVDYNYVSDDYYLKDLGGGLNAVTQNQLLQQAQINYKGQYWNFLGRIQGYQTLHPLDEPLVQNQYSRFPQLVLEGNYPSESTGLNYFITNDFSHFDIRDTPGVDTNFPMGNRLNIQPGISLPFNQPAFYIAPRLQFALTKYEIGHLQDSTSNHPTRSLPIFDINSGLYFDRELTLFTHDYKQTLEPQIYYTYVPYKNQSTIPIFDTTVNMLTYDQLFTYNRFSGLDRIGDANQISVGFTTRFIDQQSGLEKIRAGIGEIFYFKNRRVTLCTDPNICSDTPNAPENRRNRSPLSGILIYKLTERWSASANTIWDPIPNQLDNQTVALQYQQDPRRVINVGYTYVRHGDMLPFDPTNSADSNLSQTDLSAAWPVTRDWSAVARWTQNWNHSHFQNMLYGLEYDTCCWALRFIAGRAFVGLGPSGNTFQYNNEFFIQFALKGLGEVGNADPNQLLSNSITGYQTNFGQDF